MGKALATMAFVPQSEQINWMCSIFPIIYYMYPWIIWYLKYAFDWILELLISVLTIISMVLMFRLKISTSMTTRQGHAKWHSLAQKTT